MSSETGIAKAWEAAPPKVLWKSPIGGGYGTFAVVGKDAYVYVARNGSEVCLHLDADTGKELWAFPIDKTGKFPEGQGGNNPRSTPTIDGDRVYVLSIGVKLFCLNGADGKVIWSHDLQSEVGAQKIHWGNAASPVIDDDKIFVAGGPAGKAFMAFDKMTGQVIWAVGKETLTYATPLPCTIDGVRQVIFFSVNDGLVSVTPDHGQTLWNYHFPASSTATAANPVVGGKDGNIVYCSAAYGVGGAAVRIDKQGDAFNVTELWPAKKNVNMNHWSTPVASGNYLYGIFGAHGNGKEPLCCVDITTGKQMWKHGEFGSGGGTILVDNHVLVQSETGAITLVDATPDGYKEVGHVEPLGEQTFCWSAAIVANGRIYARGRTDAVCLEVMGK